MASYHLALLTLSAIAVQLTSQAALNQDGRSLTLLGDMLLTDTQFANLFNRKMEKESVFWPRNDNGVIVVPWKIEDSKVNRDNIVKGIANWSSKTCVTFEELTGSTEGKSYLKILVGDGCHAGVGREEGYPTTLSINGPACDYVGVLHEIGHALGFHHEQSRIDRDPYLLIVKENVAPDDEVQFKKEATTNYGVPYDYLSVMQYDGRAASKNGKRVMLATDPRFQSLIGTAKDLSFMDLKMFNTGYKCIDDWLKACELTADPCQNMGFTGRDCNCVCPEGTTGSKCETKQMEYNEALLQKYAPLNQKFTASGSVIQSPGYPVGPSQKQKYIQVMEAPKCHKAVLTFEDFQVEDRQGNPNCEFDRMEIRLDVTAFEGKQYCGTEIKKGDVFKSQKSTLIVHYYGYDYSKDGTNNPFKGYKATFTTEPIEGCS